MIRLTVRSSQGLARLLADRTGALPRDHKHDPVNPLALVIVARGK